MRKPFDNMIENSKKKNIYLDILKNNVVFNNPTFIQLLGMCPTLATTTSAVNAIGMGASVIVILAFSNLFISLLRKFIPEQVRIASYIVIISGFVSAVELIVKAYLPTLDKSLGLFIPLIVVNCIILARAEAFASKNKPLPSFVDGITTGLGFALAILIIAIVRELLGAGTFFGIPVFGESYKPALMFIMPAGAFLTLGVLVAAVQKLMGIYDDKNTEKALKNADTINISRPTDVKKSAVKPAEENAEASVAADMAAATASEKVSDEADKKEKDIS